jgi:S1-C subfamily serine protease
MKDRKFTLAVIIGIVSLCLIGALLATALTISPFLISRVVSRSQGTTEILPVSDVQEVATMTLSPGSEQPEPILEQGSAPALIGAPDISLTEFYNQVAPGVVSIQVVSLVQGQVIGQGAGSGFILDDEGHILTNNHVVADATLVSVIYSNGIEARAQIVGTDEYSDLAVLKVDQLIDEAHPIPVGDSDGVNVGEWVVAIGNPFGQQSSMTLGIVSATGRTISTGVTGFSIPQAIQTDAAINPGNSGGPLLNLNGEVIGVNAQIATDTGANSGVGFAIPSNIVRKVAPVLISEGAYQWPWLGVQGASVSLLLQQANGLEMQQGGYIDVIVPGGPAETAGMRGSSGTKTIDGLTVPVGGDVVIAVNGNPVYSFDDLLVKIAFSVPGETVQLTIIRDGKEISIDATLAARP